MTEVARRVDASPQLVFAVLADGWSLPLWVVGAAHVRDVDAGWPAVGSRVQHSVGSWPLLVQDYTEVVDMVPDRRLALRARAWPAGEARVVLELDPDRGGTTVRMRERAEHGPARLIPAPVEAVMLRLRNTEALDRLAAVATRRATAARGPAG